MLNYARQRVIEALKPTQKVVFATSGPAGLRASEFPCQAVGLDLYLLIPQTSDHLFNLEHDSHVTLLSSAWELKGEARVVPREQMPSTLAILDDPGAQWCSLVRVVPYQVQIHQEGGWRNIETVDLQAVD